MPALTEQSPIGGLTHIALPVIMATATFASNQRRLQRAIQIPNLAMLPKLPHP
jgi:hypothetical protein